MVLPSGTIQCQAQIMFGVKFTSYSTIDFTHNYYKHHLYHHTLLTKALKMLGYSQNSSPTELSHANLFYHMPILFYYMPDHYRSYLVIMPPFSILSLHNTKTAIEYKREAEICTLVSSPPYDLTHIHLFLTWTCLYILTLQFKATI